MAAKAMKKSGAALEKLRAELEKPVSGPHSAAAQK